VNAPLAWGQGSSARLSRRGSITLSAGYETSPSPSPRFVTLPRRVNARISVAVAGQPTPCLALTIASGLLDSASCWSGTARTWHRQYAQAQAVPLTVLSSRLPKVPVLSHSWSVLASTGRPASAKARNQGWRIRLLATTSSELQPKRHNSRPPTFAETSSSSGYEAGHARVNRCTDSLGVFCTSWERKPLHAMPVR